MSVISLFARHLADLDRQALESYPEECCGVLVGQAERVDSIRATPNEHGGSRTSRYAIAPERLLAIYKSARESGREVVGFFHSHPDRDALPSAVDLASALPGVSYLILAVDGQRVVDRRCWRMEATTGRLSELMIVSRRQT